MRCVKTKKFLFFKWKIEEHSFKPIYIEYGGKIKTATQYEDGTCGPPIIYDVFTVDSKCSQCGKEKRENEVRWNYLLKFVSSEVLREAKTIGTKLI